ncbi:hypothetical protein ACHWI2_16100, partial [Klebsiella pneumoniae]
QKGRKQKTPPERGFYQHGYRW